MMSERHQRHRDWFFFCRVLSVTLFCLSAPSSAFSAEVSSWRDQVELLRIGFVASGNRESALKRREPFRRYLAEKLAVPVTLTGFADYNALLQAHQAADIDYGIYSSSAFAIGQSLCSCIEPLAVAGDGEQIGYYAVLLARLARTDLAGLQNLDGAKVMLGRESSIAGSLLPKFALSQQGIAPQITHQDKGMHVAVQQLDEDGVDAVAAWSSLSGDPSTGYSRGTLTKLAFEAKIDPKGIKVIWQSRLIPFGPHAVRSDLPTPLKLALLEALLDLSNEPSALMQAAAAPRQGPFRAVDDVIYRPLLSALQARSAAFSQ